MNDSAPPGDPTKVALAARRLPAALAQDDLALHHDFVSENEEAVLLQYLDAQPWDCTIKRRTQHYGRRFDYVRKSVAGGDAPPPLPPCIATIVDKLLAADAALVPWAAYTRDALQVTINEYPPGVGIAAHVDTHSAFTDGIASLTLGAGISFRMQRCTDALDHVVWLPRRSLLVMRGATRYAWKHGISGRRYDRVETEAPAADGQGFEWIPRTRRVSVTLRIVLDGGKCECKWPLLCDAQGGTPIELPTRLTPATAVDGGRGSAGESKASRTSRPSRASARRQQRATSAGATGSSKSTARTVSPQSSCSTCSSAGSVWPSRRVCIALVCFRAVNALLVSTYHDPDEHWQAPEVAYRLVYGSGLVTWEWLYGLRGFTHVLPFAAWLKLLQLVHLDTPMLVAHAPRVLQGGACALGDVCLHALAERRLGVGCGRGAVACSCTSWFVWYVGVRTYSSCMEAVLIAASLALLPIAKPTRYPRARGEQGRLVPAGACAALAICVRPTAVLPLLPLGAHFLLSSVRASTGTHATGNGMPSRVSATRHTAAAAAAIAGAVVAVLVLSVLVDRLGYGRWVFAAANFVRFNVLGGGGSYYGTHPPHWYWSTALPAALGAHLPLSIHGMYLLSSQRGGRVMAAAALVAVFALSLNAHKELRFVYPLVNPLLLAYAGASLAAMSSRTQRRCLVLLTLMNIGPAVYLSFRHQRAPLALMAALRDEAARGALTHIDMLTRCHDTPGLASLHQPHVTFTMLHCPPPAVAHTIAGASAALPPFTVVPAALGARSTPKHSSSSDVLPWVASRRELRRFFPRSSSECANECDCFFDAPRAALARRYARSASWRAPLAVLRIGDAAKSGGARSSGMLARVPSHVALFDEHRELIAGLRVRGFEEVRTFWHAPRLVGWRGWWPTVEGRRLVLMRRGDADGRGGTVRSTGLHRATSM